MRICRFCRSEQHERARYGVIEGETVFPLREDEPFAALDIDRSQGMPLSEVRLLAPCRPSKIIGVGRNYRDHALELGHDVPSEPLIFLKPPSAVIGPHEAIRLPALSERVDYEGELVVVIGRRAHHIGEDESALDYVLGYTCGNDVTARDLQRRDVQFTRAKGFDTFAPLGPVIVTDLDPHDVTIETRVNGQVRQRARTSQLVFSIETLLRYISQVMTLLPGDVIYTGTPAGVGPLNPGDIVDVDIEGIGVLRNPVI